MLQFKILSLNSSNKGHKDGKSFKINIFFGFFRFIF